MRSLALILAVLLMPAVGSAQIEPEETRWSAFGFLGFEAPLSGNVSSTVSGTLVGTPLVLGNVSFIDVYGGMTRLQFGVGYRIDEQSEVLGAFSYSGGEGRRALIGVAPGQPLVGDFDDLGEKSFEVGYRYHFPRAGWFYPYAGGWAGTSRASSISAALSPPDASVASITLPVLDGSSAPVVTAGGGFILPLSSNIGISADAGLRWRGALNGANILVGTGLDRIGQDSARWSLPVVFGAVVRFGPLLP